MATGVPPRPKCTVDVAGRDPCSYGMTKQETDQIRRTIAGLQCLIRPPTPVPSMCNCPVKKFVEAHLVRHADKSVRCGDIHRLYEKLAMAGKLESISPPEFFRRLTPAMQSVFGVSKSHNVKGELGRVRGFCGIAFRSDSRPITRADLEPPIEPEFELPEPDLDPRPDDFDPRAPTVIDARPVKI